jgi:hypothetical protein
MEQRSGEAKRLRTEVGQQANHPTAELVGQRAVFKTELPHLAGGGADQSCSLKATQLVLSENFNSSDHPALSGRLTSPQNCN